jgi:Cu+-exporting ATPase
MRNRINVLIVLSLMTAIIACQKKAVKKEIAVKTIEKMEAAATANIKKASLNIEGMTCEIGCARTIQSKLSKTDGIKSAKVDFDKKTGVVEYDANKISEKQIVAAVEKIAGGDLYKVTDIKTTE